MKKKLLIVFFGIIGGLSGFSAIAMAADASVMVEAAKLFSSAATAAALGLGIAAFGTGIGQGLAVKGAVEGTARNPEASGKITVTMLIGLAMIESLCIYALVVSLILLYDAYPMVDQVKKFIGM